MKYWEECIREAFDENEIKATEEQIKNVVEWVEGAYENYGLATGLDCIPDPVESRAQQELRELKQANEKQEGWINTTQPCPDCLTTGSVKDGWGRDQGCDSCGGRGRLRKY